MGYGWDKLWYSTGTLRWGTAGISYGTGDKLWYSTGTLRWGTAGISYGTVQAHFIKPNR